MLAFFSSIQFANFALAMKARNNEPMRAISIDMIIPGVFATGLTPQTFLPSAPKDKTPALDRLVAHGTLSTYPSRPALTAVCEHLGVRSASVLASQGALCWQAEYDQPPPGWCAVVEPIHLGVGRNGLMVSDGHQLSMNVAERQWLFEHLAPVCENHEMTLHLGPRYQTLLLVSERPLDVQFPGLDQVAGSQLRDSGIQGRDRVVVNRLRNEFEMALHEAQTATHSNAEPSGQGNRANSTWLWGASTHLPDIVLGNRQVTNLVTQESLYHGLAHCLGLPTQTQSISQGSLLIDSSGLAIVKSRHVERWFQWIIQRDATWHTFANSAQARIHANLIDPLGAQFTAARWHWPWQKPADFVDCVNTVATFHHR